MPIGTYYTVEQIAVDEPATLLGDEFGEEFTANITGYIISNNDFDLVQDKLPVVGTKFDLNNGTIYSKNLSFDREGGICFSAEKPRRLQYATGILPSAAFQIPSTKYRTK